jgi:hypothetical protein
MKAVVLTGMETLTSVEKEKPQTKAYEPHFHSSWGAGLTALPSGNGWKNFNLGTVFQPGVFIQSPAIHVDHSQSFRREIQIGQKVINRCIIRQNGLKAARMIVCIK